MVASVLVVAALLSTAGQLTAQVPEAPAPLTGLGLSTLNAGVPVYFSAGHEDRGRSIGALVAESRRYHAERLGIEVEVRVALLDPQDFEGAGFPPPYGMPFVRDGVAVLPADRTAGAVVDAYRSFASTASPEVMQRLTSIGLSFREAAELMVDLVALHELGHVQSDAFGIDARQPWFGEFLATYFAYAYLREAEPDLAIVWDVVTEAGREGYDPVHTSLDTLNEIYIGVGPANYVWYQDVIHQRVSSTFDAHGLDFLTSVRERFADEAWRPDTASDLLTVLDDIAPGFEAWAASLTR